MNRRAPSLARFPSVLVAALCASLNAGAEDAWKVVSTEPVLVRARAHGKTNVKEVWAETTLAADVRDIQATLLDTDNHARFMPYVKEARAIGAPDEDGGIFAYTRLVLPVMGDRDYVVKSVVLERATSEGEGTFRQRWESHPDRLPPRNNIPRIRLNEGSWEVQPAGPETSRVVYRFQVDPGGMIPAVAIDLANRRGVIGTLQAVEKEAQRRSRLREADERDQRETSAREALRVRLERAAPVPFTAAETEPPAQ